MTSTQETIGPEPEGPYKKELPPDYSWGEYEIVRKPTSAYIKMAQVRGEKNRVGEQLKEDIFNNGLINPIDVVRLDLDHLLTYIDFINTVWGSKTKAESFLDFAQDDGFYYLIIAGHSRHEALCELQEEGRVPVRNINAKIHTISSPGDIIRIQMGENVYDKPPLERRAMAIVESYQWGLAHGDWGSMSEYLKSKGAKKEGVTKGILYEAMQFTYLPSEIRESVFSGTLSYTAGVELGKSVDALRKWIKREAGIALSSQSNDYDDKIELLVLLKLKARASHILNQNMNSTAAKKHLQGWRNSLSVEKPEGFELYTASQILDNLALEEIRQLRAFMTQHAGRPLEVASEYLALAGSMQAGLEDIYTPAFLETLKVSAQSARDRLMASRVVSVDN